MRRALLTLILLCTVKGAAWSQKDKLQDIRNADEIMKVWEAARLGDVRGLEHIKLFKDVLAAERVLTIVSDPYVYFDIREIIAGMVAQWPDGAGHEHLIKRFRAGHAECPWTTFHFYTSLALPAFEPIFRSILEAQKDVPLDEIRHPSRLAAVIRVFERYAADDDALIELMIRYLDQRAPHVLRMSAATTLGSLRNAASLPALIANVSDGIIGKDVIGSLYRLTGEDFGNKPDVWRVWFTTGGGNVPLKMLSRAQLAEHRANAPKFPPAEESFYGLEIKGKRLVFVLDVSNSMKGEKIERLRGEATDLLSALQHRPRDLRYDLISFASLIKSCSKGTELMPNDDVSLEKAMSFVGAMDTSGGTRMNAALDHVATNLLPANNVDTIYLLTDGAPTDMGPDYYKDEKNKNFYRTVDIMNRVRLIHYWYQVRINTIFIKQRPAAPTNPPSVPRPGWQWVTPPATLLRDIAELTSGEFTQPE